MTFGNVSIKEIITVTFTLFAVIDMLGNIPVLASLRAKMGGEIRSVQATVASGGLMILFLLVGQQFLNILGLDVQSFAVAGSIVIFIIGLEMVLGIEFLNRMATPKVAAWCPLRFHRLLVRVHSLPS